MANPHFEIINGYSNEYWGWGGDDDELRRRIEAKHIPIHARKCKFKSLPHNSNVNHDVRMKNVQRLKSPIDWADGLSSCEYEVVNCEEKESYTLFTSKIMSKETKIMLGVYLAVIISIIAAALIFKKCSL